MDHDGNEIEGGDGAEGDKDDEGELEGCTRRTLGPRRHGVSRALEPLGLAPEECVMIGDRLETDIRMSERAGMRTALVCTGVTDRSDVLDGDVEPDHILDSIADIGGILE